ncbi:MAG TPA: hypothetical protein DCY88_09920 [Cyanobacteria bacterium UBA11372]|nr:hypothetical protein [Cyanobacteria bacterium UBA11372]
MTNNASKVTVHWQELDVLRGLAALLMILNHVGYNTLATAEINGIWAASLLFITSCAPVLFFFVTGVGYGIQSSQKKKLGHWCVIFNKVIILFLADLLIHWSNGRWLGLEFLGFIAISSLVMEFIRRSKSPLTYCLIGFVAIFIIRYLLGHFIHSLGYDQKGWWLLDWIIGTTEIDGVSYPLSPWIAYPLAGYIVGVVAMGYRDYIKTHRLQVVVGLLMGAGVPAIASLILLQRGSSFFRWGTVSLGFYIVSFAILLVSIAGTLAFCGEPKLSICQNALSLKGIASLAVVPVHYFLIDLVTRMGAKELNLLSYGIIAIAVLTISFLGARFVEYLSSIIVKIKKQKVVWVGLVAMFLLASGLTLIYNRESTSLVMLTRTFGQIVLCLLFAMRLPL